MFPPLLSRVSRAGMHFVDALHTLLRQVSHDLDMKPQVYALLLALLLWADFLEAARQLRPRGGYRRKKVSLLKSVKVYYKDPRTHPPCRRSRLGRIFCSRPRKLRVRQKPSRSDPIADYENEIPNTTTPKTTTSTTTQATFPSQDFGPYFSEIAKAFAQSLDSGAILNQVQYTGSSQQQHQDSCPKLPSGQAQTVCASNFAMHQCWSVGQKDSDCQGDLCCFNGCENVCFRPKEVGAKWSSTTPAPPAANGCPLQLKRSHQACQNSQPNCWSAGQFDLDCPQSGLCCFDGCANRCLLTPPTDAGQDLNQTQYLPPPQEELELPLKEVSKPLENYNHPSVMTTTTSGYSSINQREPSLVLHIYGPPQSQPQVLFGQLPSSMVQAGNNHRLARQVKKKRFHLKPV